MLEIDPEDRGELIDSASAGCANPHCGETPDQKRLRELAELGPVQPKYTDCHNCGTVDHGEYVCPCACHGRDR